jgi:hypothetical protein
MKATQADDSAPYKEVEHSIKSLGERKYDEDKREATRLIVRASFAHNGKNTIGAAMASEINERGSRFYFSHDAEYCPLVDVVGLLHNSLVDGIAKYNADGTVYCENHALHYLCRSEELEDVSLAEFTSEYYKVDTNFFSKKRKRDKQDEVFPFEADTGYFKHPSAYKKKPVETPTSTARQSRTAGTPKSNKKQSSSKKKQAKKPATPRTNKTPTKRDTPDCRQGLKLREKPVLIRI